MIPFHSPVRGWKCLYSAWHLPNRRRSTASQNGVTMYTWIKQLARTKSVDMILGLPLRSISSPAQQQQPTSTHGPKIHHGSIHQGQHQGFFESSQQGWDNPTSFESPFAPKSLFLTAVGDIFVLWDGRKCTNTDLLFVKIYFFFTFFFQILSSCSQGDNHVYSHIYFI